LNVTFGNAPELIIAFFALNEGLQEVVKASLAGSILGNTLLVMGAAMLVGGLGRERQFFDRTAANVTSLMLLLAVVALIAPAIFELVQGTGLPRPDAEAVDHDSDVEKLSVGVAIVLLLTYVAGLFSSLRTHTDLFDPEHAADDHVGEPWPVRRSVLMLLRARGSGTRGADRPAGHARERVDLVRRPPAARGLRGAGAHVLLRLMAAPPLAFFSGPLPWLNLARPTFAALRKAAPLPRDP
jgi:Ca2+/H+ antiporter